MKVYTKTGDGGKTSLIGGTRTSKRDLRLHAYGTMDELNAFVGLLASFLDEEDENKKYLLAVQHTLFDIGSCLALDAENQADKYGIAFDGGKIGQIESEIDRLSGSLPALKTFVIPGGGKTAALCHVCRTLTRRGERILYEMTETYPVKKDILIFINRLSDYFFVLARFLNHTQGEEIFYAKS